MSRIRLYIADMDAEFVGVVRAALKRNPLVEIVGSASNGRQALNDLLRLTPDVLLTDLSLPALDGIGLLRETRRMRRPPTAIVCTRFYTHASMDCACRNGASFFLCKPVEPESLANLVVESRRDAQSPSPCPAEHDDASEHLVRRIRAAQSLLVQMGLPPRLSGSLYILEAVVRCEGDPALVKNLSSGLYSEIAQRMDATVPRVERAIRSAIAVAYARGALARRFPQRPSNRQFIEFVLDHVEDGQATDPMPLTQNFKNV